MHGQEAAAEFKRHGLDQLITVQQRDIEEQGFPQVGLFECLSPCIAAAVMSALPTSEAVVRAAYHNQCAAVGGRTPARLSGWLVHSFGLPAWKN